MRVILDKNYAMRQPLLKAPLHRWRPTGRPLYDQVASVISTSSGKRCCCVNAPATLVPPLNKISTIDTPFTEQPERPLCHVPAFLRRPLYHRVPSLCHQRQLLSDHSALLLPPRRPLNNVPSWLLYSVYEMDKYIVPLRIFSSLMPGNLIESYAASISIRISDLFSFWVS